MSIYRWIPNVFATTTLILASACSPGPVLNDEPLVELDREAFNKAAQRLDLPMLWVADENANLRPDPEEIIELAFFDSEFQWVDEGAFSSDFGVALAAIEAELGEPDPDTTLSEQEGRRRSLVAQELDQARPTLVQADLGALEPWEHEMLDRFWAAGEAIDELYAIQLGVTGLEERLAEGDTASRRLFRRNRGPGCVAPMTQGEADCSALPGKERTIIQLYPAGLQAEDDFCAILESDPDAVELTAPFTVVEQGETGLVAVPYSTVYKPGMTKVATELRAAAALIPDGHEEALEEYLEAAAGAFETNDWPSADEAWANMSARNSAWYLRIAPDETYWEPCSLKAGFHVTLARVDPASISWQDRLSPLRNEMEKGLAELAGAPYEARQVDFDLPDFLELIANFGDDRDPLGGTAGQSLPNWGAVANEGRGRTVAMTNLGTDPGSRRIRREQLASLVDAETMQALSPGSPDDGAELLNTILHEAAHNLGPAHEYRVDGKLDTEVFGGSLATTMEELKAQTFGLWLLELVREQGIIDENDVREAYASAFAWSMRHISSGMVTGGGHPRAYSQLSAIQIGFLMDQGALSYDDSATAANGTDQGAFHLDFAKFPAAWTELSRLVGSMKAQGLADEAEAMRTKYVEGDTVPFETIEQRILRHPAQTFVYTNRR